MVVPESYIGPKIRVDEERFAPNPDEAKIGKGEVAILF
jgi:hypothetical protein